MSQRENVPRVAVVGAGAVGGYYGALMARAGASVIMIGRPAFVDAVRTGGLRVDAREFQDTLHVEASTELDAVRGANLVLFCVKTTDTAVTARALVPLLPPGADVVSLQNGVDNAEQIRAASGLDALGSVVYVAAAAPEPGLIRHFGRGDLVLGPITERTQRVAALFERYGVPCKVSDNLEGELWTKLVINAALNPVSALGQATYGRIAESADGRRLLDTIIAEVLAVARAAKLNLPGMETQAAAVTVVTRITEQMPGQFSSTGQDLLRGRHTEIDSLNGHVARRGAELGVPTPVNHALYTLVKLAETRKLAG